MRALLRSRFGCDIPPAKTCCWYSKSFPALRGIFLRRSRAKRRVAFRKPFALRKLGLAQSFLLGQATPNKRRAVLRQRMQRLSNARVRLHGTGASPRMRLQQYSRRVAFFPAPVSSSAHTQVLWRTRRTSHGRSEERRVGKEGRSRWSPD